MLTGLNQQFTKEVQEFVKLLYAAGQTALQSDFSRHSSKEPLNSFALTISSNVACIELLLWAISDDSEAESLCTRLTGKINTVHEHRLLVAHHPLLLVALQVGLCVCR